MTTLYKGFEAQSSFNETQGLYIGQVANCEDTIVFYGRSPEELERSFRFCVDTYLAVCKQKGYAPSLATRTFQQVLEQEAGLPFSGRLMKKVGMQ